MLSVLRGNLKFKYLFFSMNIHICNHSCTWKELLNYKNFLRRFPVLWGQKIRHFNIFKFGYELLCQRRVFLGACWLVWLKFDIDNSKDGRQWVLTYIKVINRPMTHIFVNTVSLFHVGAWTESTTRVESVIKEWKGVLHTV